MNKQEEHRKLINKRFKEAFKGMDETMQGLDVHDRVRFLNIAIHELRVKISRHANFALENLAGLDPKDYLFTAQNSEQIFNCVWARNHYRIVEDPENQVYGVDVDQAPMPDNTAEPEQEETSDTGSITPSR